MTLHPSVAVAIGRQPRVPPHPDRVAEARRSMVDAIADEVAPVAFPGPIHDVDAGGVPGRLYRPLGGEDPPTVLFAHGGGWVLGDLETHDGVCRQLAALSGRAVLSVDYRRAPEHPGPAASDDLDTAARWLRSGGAVRYGVRGDQLAVCGDSAGGHLAAVAARRGRDGGTPYACQALICPVLDPAMNYDPELERYGLSGAEMRFFWDAYAPADRRGHEDFAPLLGDPSGLPPTLVITAEYDVLRDEGEAYAARLAAAGVSAVAVRYQGMNHGFFRKTALIDAAGAALAQAAVALRQGI
jgi:acetyl esterase